MFTEERRQVIVSALSLNGSLSVTEIARLVHSSQVTVRRDLVALEEAGMVIRRRGGATIARLSIEEPTYLEKSTVASLEKRSIAREAAAMIADGDVVMLGPGTTTQELAKRLVERRIMVATTSILVADELRDAPGVETILIGGVFRGEIRATVGGDAERAVGRLRFQKLFLSGNGLTGRTGLTTPNAHVAGVDRAAADSSTEIIALVDHTKVGVDSIVQTVPTSRIGTLITDSAADADELDALRAGGVVVKIAATD